MSYIVTTRCNCWGVLERVCEGCRTMEQRFKDMEWRDAMNRLRKHREKRKRVYNE